MCFLHLGPDLFFHGLVSVQELLVDGVSRVVQVGMAHPHHAGEGEVLAGHVPSGLDASVLDGPFIPAVFSGTEGTALFEVPIELSLPFCHAAEHLKIGGTVAEGQRKPSGFLE